MISTQRQEILRRLTRLLELAPSLRVGQLMAHIDLLGDDMFDKDMAELDDQQLLEVLQRHELELSEKQSNVA